MKVSRVTMRQSCTTLKTFKVFQRHVPTHYNEANEEAHNPDINKSDRQQGNLNNSDQKHQREAFVCRTEAHIKGDAGNTTTGLLLYLHQKKLHFLVENL